jgi:cell wall-associated NlpC family hydrolase
MTPDVFAADRERLVAEARSWIGTPYVRKGMIKKVGCDCGTFMFAVYRSCGLIPDEEIGVFSDDWWANTTDEKYMKRILRHASKVAQAISYPTLEARPGNIVLSRHSDHALALSHGGIVTRWPMLIHAVGDPGVEETDATKHEMWCFREVLIFDPWLKRQEAAA